MPSDLSAQAFLTLRRAFFDEAGQSVPFGLVPKGNTQDDPFDRYVAALLSERLQEATCQKSSGPLINPDFVIYRREECVQSLRSALRGDVSNIVAIEVKKLERGVSGQVARSTGLDYNTTPPCGIVRVYDAGDQATDIRAFYLFVCQEKRDDGSFVLTALTLCDGNLLNADFNLYLEITGLRMKGLGLGTYGDGVNRNRPMLIFANPLGAPQFDHHSTWIAGVPPNKVDACFAEVYEVGRTEAEGGERLFYAYRIREDVPVGWEPQRLLDPFPKPIRRVEATQARGRFRLPFKPLDPVDAVSAQPPSVLSGPVTSDGMDATLE